MSASKLSISSEEGQFSALISRPKDPGLYPVIIVIQDVFGLSHPLKLVCDHFAQQGYIAIAPDLYWRLEPDLELVSSFKPDLDKAMSLYKQLDQNLAIKDLKTTINFVRQLDGSNKKVGLSGYCLGGRLAFMASY